MAINHVRHLWQEKKSTQKILRTYLLANHSSREVRPETYAWQQATPPHYSFPQAIGVTYARESVESRRAAECHFGPPCVSEALFLRPVFHPPWLKMGRTKLSKADKTRIKVLTEEGHSPSETAQVMKVTTRTIWRVKAQVKDIRERDS